MSLSPAPVGSPAGSASPSPGPSSSTAGTSSNKYNLSPAEVQRLKLDRLLKNPDKPVSIPNPAKEKTLRPPREMMKNVQGSSAGAGSGEFHVYKQNRRREYERLKLMDEKAKKDEEQRAFDERQKTALESADAKTSKNRLKRQKKKARQGGKPLAADDGAGSAGGSAGGDGGAGGAGKKRKLGGGAAAIVFKRPGEESSDEDEDEGAGPEEDADKQDDVAEPEQEAEAPRVVVDEQPMIVIHDD